MENTIAAITQLFKKRYHTDLSVFDRSFVTSLILRRIEVTGCSTPESYGTLISREKGESQNFYSSLRIGYSEFFRNPLTFAVLERIVLPELIVKKRSLAPNEIRIWSAACAAGQEAYSMAILLEEIKTLSETKFKYRIFATDVSETNIVDASMGRYYLSSVKNVSLNRAERWFTRGTDFFSVVTELKENIDFSSFDLLDNNLGCPSASIFGAFDLIFCANMLFYYLPEQRKIMLDKLVKCLSLGGCLITGETEREILLKAGFREMVPNSAIFQLKNNF